MLSALARWLPVQTECAGPIHVFPPHAFVCQCGRIRAVPVLVKDKGMAE